MRSTVPGCCLLLILSIGLCPARGETQRIKPVIDTRQVAFSIPFNLRPPASAQEVPREVFLYVSSDNGANWKLTSRVDPRQGRFDFHAPKDGEYWFVVRTVNQAGQVLSTNRGQPELRVRVDTRQPTLELAARLKPSGEIEARWNAEDPQLDVASLKLEFRTASGGDWKEVAFSQEGVQRPSSNVMLGTATWNAAADVTQVAVRATVADRAGNRSVIEATAGAAQGSAPLAGQPSGSALPDYAPVAQSRAASVTTVSPHTGPAEPVPAFRRDGSAVWPRDRLSDSPPSQLPETNPKLETKNPQLDRTPQQDRQQEGDTNNQQAKGNSRETAPNATGGVAVTGAKAPIADSDAAGAEAPAWAGSVHPPVAQRVTAADARPSTQTATTDGTIQPQIVDGNSFQLHYEMTRHDAAAIHKVELWGTPDAGRTWRYFGSDIDRRSPLDVTVPGPGLYGFRLIVQAANTAAPPSPRSGELPEIWVLVRDARPEASGS